MLDNIHSVSPVEQQQVLEALERLQSKLLDKEDWTNSSTLRTLRDALQSPLMGHVLRLTHSVRQLALPPPSPSGQLICSSTNACPLPVCQVPPPLDDVQDWMKAAEATHTEQVLLTRPSGEGFGFRVVCLNNRGVFISHIQPGGVAYNDGRLQVKDQILLVNGNAVQSSVGQQEALFLLQQEEDTVELVVARSRPPDTPTPTVTTAQRTPPPVVMDKWAEVEHVQLTNDGSGLGFGIVGGKTSGVVIRTVIPGSAAHRDGRLRTGDYILSIGDTPTSGLTSDEVIKVLQLAGSHVSMVIGREPQGQLTMAPPPLPPISAPVSTPVRHVSKTPNLEGFEIHEVSLSRLPGQSLGISIVGQNTLTSQDAVGVFVKHVVPGSAADQSGNIRVHDRLIALDGISLHGLTNLEVLDVMKQTGPTVLLTIVRRKRAADTREESRVKWQQALGPQYDVLVVTLDLVIEDDAELQRSSKLLPVHTLRLGVELDSFDGHHYVSSVTPGGAAHKQGVLRAEDELLEVNGVQLYGKSRREVVSFLKQVPPPFTLTCCRHLNSEPEPEPGDPSADRLDEIERQLSKALRRSNSQHVREQEEEEQEEEQEDGAEPAHWSTDVEVVELEKDRNGGLGFSLLDYQDPVDPECCVMVVRSLVPGGPAQLHGGLLPGDQLVSVNETQLRQLDLNRTVEVLKSAPPGTVQLGVRRPAAPAARPKEEELLLSTGEEGQEMGVDEEEQLEEEQQEEAQERKPPPPSWERWKSSFSLLVDDDVPLLMSEGQSPADKRRRGPEAATIPRVRGQRALSGREAGEGEETQHFSHWSAPRRVDVCVEEGGSLGLSIVGGSHVIRRLRNGEELRGIFIKHVLPESPAALTGRLKTGDKILEVGGVDLRSASHEEAVIAIKSAQSPISFIVQSLSAAPRPLSLKPSSVRSVEENPAFAPPPRREPPPYRPPSQSGPLLELRLAKGLV